MAKDRPKGFAVCFHCNQNGHRKAECPQLRGASQGSAPAAVRASDSRPVKTETLKARGRAFQLTAEEVRAAPDVVAGMYSFMYFFFDVEILCLCYVMRRYLSCELCTCFSVI